MDRFHDSSTVVANNVGQPRESQDFFDSLTHVLERIWATTDITANNYRTASSILQTSCNFSYTIRIEEVLNAKVSSMRPHKLP